MENITKEDNEFEPRINEPHEGVVDDEQLRILPANEEEEKEEKLLPSTTAAKTTKPIVSSSKGKSSRKRRRDETSSADTIKQLKRQATQLDKITIMLRSIQKSTKGQSRLISQLQSQIKQLRTQMSQIQKNITKRNFTTATTSSRKKTRPKKR